jgi:hypothetical protein
MTSTKYIGMDVHKESISVAVMTALLCSQASVGIAGIPWLHREPLLPRGKETHLQEMIGRSDAVDSR